MKRISIYPFLIAIIFLTTIISCSKNGTNNNPAPTYTIPVLTTDTTSSITQTTAQSGGVIISNGGNPITTSGICWSISQNPTINNNLTTDGTKSGSFISKLSGLTSGTTYYVRAYATNSVGTAYGNQVNFTTQKIVVNLPTVISTSSVTNLTSNSATYGGNVTDNGGSTILAKGVCWSSTTQPTVALSTKTNDGTGLGSFTSTITGLNQNTYYYFRAYATNSAGTSYGLEYTFKTLPKTYSLGDNFGGGIIVYLDSTKQHGLIVSPNDVRASCVWDSGAKTSMNLNASGTIIGTGSSNTKNIISIIGNGNNAASYCANYRGGGYSDWFLPSQDELKALLGYALYASLYDKNSPFYNTNWAGNFWTSTETIQSGALYGNVTYGLGILNANICCFYAKVRAIRAF